ncbi:MAG: CHAT domain-containing protein [Fimbriimonadales bacterium]
MDRKSAIDAIAATRDSKAAGALIRGFRGQEGFSAEYFARLHAAFGSNVGEARCLASHWRLMLRYGDDAAFAYRAKGVLDRLSSRWLESAKAFIKSGSLAKSGRDKLSFQAGAIDGLARAGQVGKAVALGRRLVKGLDSLGEEGLAGRIRLNLGHALLWIDQYEPAKRWLNEAVPALHRGGHLAESVYAQLSLSTAELFGGSPIEAHRLADQARAAAADAGLDYATAMCELNLAQSALMQGRADEALHTLLRTRPGLADSPPDSLRVSEFLGDAYLRLNLWPEAVNAYEEAIAGRKSLPALNVAASFLGRGQALVAEGQPDSALESLRRARRAFSRCGNVPWAAAADTWTAKALIELGRVREAQRLAAGASERARKSRSPWHEAEALLTKIECGDAGNLNSDLRRASQIIGAHGYTSMAWRTMALRARFAPPGQRLGAYSRALESILAARMLTASSMSRTAYLRDKSRTISEYLALLLAKPTPSRIRRAIDAITRSRSASLLDEILTSAAGELQSDQLAQLEQLRSELQALEAEGQVPNNARRARPSPQRIAGLQRKWIEATHRLISSATSAPSEHSEAVVLAQAEHEVFVLRGASFRSLSISAEELRGILKWVRFELLAPMTDRDSDPQPANGMILELAHRLVEPWLGRHQRSIAICPEGLLWQVPWASCLASLDLRCEPVLALHPRLTAISDSRLGGHSKAMLWIDRAKDLYHAGSEQSSFLEKFPDARVCRSAREARESLGEQVDILHVICHARHSASNPMFSALQFGDGAVYATEVARSAFRAEMVTLSACDTGDVSVADRDEPDGLARSFLARGAKSVVGSLWPLDDEAAAKMYDNVYGGMLQGASLVEALSCARQTIRDWRGHPYFGGSLVLFGGYGN